MNPSLLPLARREFLRTSGLGCGSLALAYLLGRDGALAAERQPHFAPKAKSIIWLFMTGGPSQVDTFDYKPELQKRDGQSLAGADPKTGFFTTSGKCLASPFKWSRHGRSGSWVSDVYPTAARHADDMAFVHSCHSVANNHAPASMELAAGMSRPGYPTLGAWLSYGLGSANDNLPAFVVMHDAKPRGDDGIWSPGFLPKTYQPLLLDARQKEAIRDVAPLPGVTDTRQKAMLDLLRESNLEHQQAHGDQPDLSARIRSFELAYRMQAAAPEALDISRESAKTQALYGLDNKDCAGFGRQCLIARRLVERGVRFVQVFSPTNRISGGAVGDVPWDGHNDILVNHRDCGMMTDIPFAGLLSDLKQRGLLNETLVIWGGEFGRTSDSQGSKGRDHNPRAYTTIFCGGGTKGGVHYGKTDEFGYKAVEDKVTVHDLQATILHLMGLNHEKLTYRHNGRDFRLTDVAGRVIREVIS
ncbi:MAG: DUF1501 domain-containing protein [Planctomycetes bacterium]|nr:DUF1501 domain-containing protein [Planctomycetota bacterium]